MRVRQCDPSARVAGAPTLVCGGDHSAVTVSEWYWSLRVPEAGAVANKE